MPRFTEPPTTFPPSVPTEDTWSGGLPSFAFAEGGVLVSWTPPRGFAHAEHERFYTFVSASDAPYNLEISLCRCFPQEALDTEAEAEQRMLHSFRRSHELTRELAQSRPELGVELDPIVDRLERRVNGARTTLLYEFAERVSYRTAPDPAFIHAEAGVVAIEKRSDGSAVGLAAKLTAPKPHPYGAPEAALSELRHGLVAPTRLPGPDEAGYWLQDGGFFLDVRWRLGFEHSMARGAWLTQSETDEHWPKGYRAMVELGPLLRSETIDPADVVALERRATLYDGRSVHVTAEQLQAPEHEFLASCELDVGAEIWPAFEDEDGYEPESLKKPRLIVRVAYVRVGPRHVVRLRLEVEQHLMEHVDLWWSQALASLRIWSPE